MISFFSRLLALLTILCHTGFAAPYHRPGGSMELFQLEKIPLRVNTMKEISRHLVILACRKQDDSAEQRRASAQLLAIAMRLDPTNKKIRETDKTFHKGKTPQEPHIDQIVQAKSILRSYHRWLASPDAGVDANLLANLMVDATKTLDPQTRHHPDTADWSKVLPALPPPPKAEPAPTPEIKPTKAETDIAKRPKPDPRPVAQGSQFYIPQLVIHAPLTLDIKEKYNRPTEPDKTYYRYITKKSITSIEIEITQAIPKDEDKSKKPKPPTFSFSPLIEKESTAATKKAPPAPVRAQKKLTTLDKIQYTLKTLLQSRHGTFPTTGVKIKIKQGRYALSNDLAVTAPLAIMLEASVTNQPLRNDIHICAAINAQGKLRQSKNFWQQIKFLRESESGGRLIVAEESSDLLMQSLVFGDPAFFTRWEIFTAATLDQAMEIATATNPQHITEASALFRTIQDLTQKSQVTQIAVNSAVKYRLSEIIKLSPNHCSSKALLLQGSPNRPSRLNKLALAHELAPVIQRIDKLLSSEIGTSLPSADTLKKIHAELRESLDALERLVDGTEDDIYQQALKLASDFRRLATLSRRSASSSSSTTQNSIAQSANDIVLSMQYECATLKTKSQKIIQAQ